jgi:hypothetical protein
MMLALIYGSPALLAIVAGIYVAYRGAEAVMRGSFETTDEPRVSRVMAALGVGFAAYLLYRGSADGTPISVIAGAFLLLAAGDVLWRQHRRSVADRARAAELDREWSCAPRPKKRGPF